MLIPRQAEVESPLVPLGAEIVFGLIVLVLAVLLIGTLIFIARAVRESRRPPADLSDRPDDARTP